MKAISIDSPGKVSVLDCKSPERKQGEALLKILYGGICGSDLGSYRGTFAYFDYPRIPGHELAAEVIEIDENVKGIKAGDIVTCNPYFNCGHCYSCERGHVNACEHNETMGCQRDGGFCEYIVMPVERLYDGRGIPPKILAAVEPCCISYHGVKRGEVRAGDKVLVLGAGTIGLLAALAAKQIGAEVYISDVLPDKLELALRFGIDGIIVNDRKEHFDAQVAEITEGHGFDVTIEAVGRPSTFQDCIDACCYCGRVVLIGIGKLNLDFNFTLIQKKELNIFGSRNATEQDFKEVIDLVASGKIPLAKVVTNEYGYLDAAQAFEDFSNNKGDMLKVVLNFGGKYEREHWT